jgi:integrase
MQEQFLIHLRSDTPPNKSLLVWDNPGRVIDRNGRPVNTSKEIWQLHDPTDNINVNWDRIRTAPDIKEAIKFHVASTIESNAPRTSHQVFKQLKYCLDRLPSFKSTWDISFEAIEGAITKARAECKDWHFHYIRKWYAWCEDQGLLGFSGEVASRLYQLKINKNASGEKVMTRDVNDGPLTSDEHFLIRTAVKENKGSLVDRVIIMLLLELGSRPVQLVQLEEQDFVKNIGPSGHKFYSLDVPRAKQREVGEPSKKRRRISPELGQLIEELIERNHHIFGARGTQMPLLCIKSDKHKKLTEELRSRYEFHMKVVGLGQRVRGYVNSANVISPRTGKPLKLHARRLRYTYFTLLAEQGTSASHLAELADHSNDKSILIYVSSTSSTVDRLNAALGKDKHYIDVIVRFLGSVIENSEGQSLDSVIEGATPTLKSLGGIGVCGANFLCELYPPLSCYVCPKFQAWIDGPHEKLLLELEAYVQQLVNRSKNRSDRIPHQLVDVIVAIRQLLKRIEELREGDGKGKE